jgi:hypothetical protein
MIQGVRLPPAIFMQQANERTEVICIMQRERLHPVIDSQLARIARSTSQAPAWFEPWLGLGPQSTEQERLTVCQAIRNSGSLPAHAGYFLVSLVLENMSSDRVSRLAHGLLTMNQREWRRTSDRVFAKLMDEANESEMARLFRSDPLEHTRRREAGRQFFFGRDAEEGPADSGWLQEFSRVISSSLVTDKATRKLGVRHQEEDGNWTIAVYPLRQTVPPELIEPSASPPGYAWDIQELQSVFDLIEGMGWFAVPTDRTESPYLWIEGEFQGHQIFLRLLPVEPDQVEPGGEFDVG